MRHEGLDSLSVACSYMIIAGWEGVKWPGLPAYFSSLLKIFFYRIKPDMKRILNVNLEHNEHDRIKA